MMTSIFYLIKCAVDTHIHIYMHTYICAHVLVHRHLQYIHSHMGTCMSKHMHTLIHTYVYTHKHKHTHTRYLAIVNNCYFYFWKMIVRLLSYRALSNSECISIDALIEVCHWSKGFTD